MSKMRNFNIRAPFSREIIAAIRAFQDNTYVHPLTCGMCDSDAPMMVLESGLNCKSCGHIQAWIPESVLRLTNPALAGNFMKEQ